MNTAINELSEMRCLACHSPLDQLTLAFLGKEATHCMRCDATWQVKVAPIPAGFHVWEETLSGKTQNERLWWKYCDICDKGWLQQRQCYRCQGRIELARCAVPHPSGALKIPREHDYQRHFLWFPDCPSCQAGRRFIHYRNGGGETRQCEACYCRYVQWLKEYGRIRYVVSRPNYPIRLKIDTTKRLEKSKGRIFYHEVDYAARTCEGTRVQAYEVDSGGKTQEALRIDGMCAQGFPSISEAQDWVGAQMGGSLREYWLR